MAKFKPEDMINPETLRGQVEVSLIRPLSLIDAKCDALVVFYFFFCVLLPDHGISSVASPVLPLAGTLACQNGDSYSKDSQASKSRNSEYAHCC